VAAATVGDTTTPNALLPQTRVRVRILDLNDNAPVFGQGSYAASVREDANVAPPRLLVTVSATDADSGFNGLILYELVQGNATLFVVDAQTGAVKLRSSLDYETAHSHTLVVMARDRGPEAGQPQLTANVTVTVTVLDANDNAPVLNASSYSVSVYENATVGTALLAVSASDADSGDNARVSFAVVSATSGASVSFVSVDASGVITLASLVDYDAAGGAPVLRFNVRASDNPTNGDPSLRSEAPVTVTILDVNDNRPQWVVDAGGQQVGG
jgi:hypothetical protein